MTVKTQPIAADLRAAQQVEDYYEGIAAIAEHPEVTILAKIISREMEPEREAERQKFESHTKAVGEFLYQLYMVMVDPCADEPIKVADMQQALLEAARRDREAAYSSAGERREMLEALKAEEATLAYWTGELWKDRVSLEEIRQVLDNQRSILRAAIAHAKGKP